MGKEINFLEQLQRLKGGQNKNPRARNQKKAGGKKESFLRRLCGCALPPRRKPYQNFGDFRENSDASSDKFSSSSIRKSSCCASCWATSNGGDRNDWIDGDDEDESVKYPKAVGFIISNEFCERFNYYGMRTILVLYLTNKLHYDADTSTVLFHVFTMLVYLCPLIGAIIADSWLGKYKTILYLSIVYAIGGVIIAVGAIPTIDIPVKESTILGLILIAIGTGGIKPCVSAFGGDQFQLPEQTKQLATFFSLFYFAINAGSMISTSITPILRQDVHCFGEKDCFSLAFGVPAILMLLSVIIFVAGRKLYIMKPPTGNMIFGVSKCINDAFFGWRRERKTNPRKHWLDYAEEQNGRKMVEDTKVLVRILILYLPFPVFWALFDQQGSRWTFQANRMDGDFYGYVIKPDQMQVINPLLILGFIPIFDYILYPILSVFGIRRPLQKLALGGLLAAVAFVLSALLEMKIEGSTLPVMSTTQSQFRVYNGMHCAYTFKTDLLLNNGSKSFIVEPLGIWEESHLTTPRTFSYNLTAHLPANGNMLCPSYTGHCTLEPGQSKSLYINPYRLLKFSDPKVELGVDDGPNGFLRVLTNTNGVDYPLVLYDPLGVQTKLSSNNVSRLIPVAKGVSKIKLHGKTIANITTKTCGIYGLLLQGTRERGFTFKGYITTSPERVHMLWQLPQIIVITAAEIMFSVTGLEFSFTQAPQSMKSVLQACWLLSVAIGNMLVVVVAEMKIFDSQAAEFILFACLMVIDIIVFMLLSINYTYRQYSDDFDNDNEGKSKNGIANDGYED